MKQLNLSEIMNLYAFSLYSIAPPDCASASLFLTGLGTRNLGVDTGQERHRRIKYKIFIFYFEK